MGGARSLLVGLLATVGAYALVGAPVPSSAQAQGPQVLMVDNEPDLTRWHFDPAQISVPAGTTVVWFNKGKEDHSVKADDNSFDSGLKPKGTTFSRVFNRPGKYKYHCAPHPWMTGTVEVTSAVRTAAADNPDAVASTSTTVAAAPPASTPASAPAPAAAVPAPAAGETATTAPPPAAEDAAGDAKKSEDESAAPASSHGKSGDPLAGTLAIVLLPTLGALALGAKLRQSRT